MNRLPVNVTDKRKI